MAKTPVLGMESIPEHQLPQALRAQVRGYRWEHISTGETAASVFRLAGGGAAPRFLKITPQEPAADPLAEVRRMEWLGGRLPVPRVLAYAEHRGRTYTVMSAVAGVDATEPALLRHPSQLVGLLAHGLRLIHALPVAGCPFDHRLDAEFARLHASIAAKLNTEDDQAVSTARAAAERLASLERIRPLDERAVFMHGDYCLPNIMIDGDRVSGFIDLGAAGVGDPYRDLALAARSITRNLGAEWVAPFFAAYGLHSPDVAKIAFYQALDELF